MSTEIKTRKPARFSGRKRQDWRPLRGLWTDCQPVLRRICS